MDIENLSEGQLKQMMADACTAAMHAAANVISPGSSDDEGVTLDNHGTVLTAAALRLTSEKLLSNVAKQEPAIGHTLAVMTDQIVNLLTLKDDTEVRNG